MLHFYLAERARSESGSSAASMNRISSVFFLRMFFHVYSVRACSRSMDARVCEGGSSLSLTSLAIAERP